MLWNSQPFDHESIPALNIKNQSTSPQDLHSKGMTSSARALARKGLIVCLKLSIKIYMLEKSMASETFLDGQLIHDLMIVSFKEFTTMVTACRHFFPSSPLLLPVRENTFDGESSDTV